MQVLQGGMRLKPVRVLVADDDAVLRSLVRTKLEGRVDAVAEAEDGQQAWDILLGGSFELALIDLSMPGLDGFALIRCIRSNPRTKHLPIVVITSSTDQNAVKRAFEAGATSFLTKPINWNLFAHQIDYLIRFDQESSTERATKQRAEAVARAKDALIAALAARVRAQTRQLIGSSEQALSHAGDVSRQGADFAAEVLAEARRIEEIINDTMPFVRSMTEQIVVDDRLVSVARIVDACIDRLRPVAEQGDVRFAVGHIPSELRIRCDEAALCRAVGNILRNAVEFTRSGTTVEIAVELREDDALCLTIDDEGPGADPETIARCLKPLDVRSGVDLAPPEQAALGLPIAMAIARAHGGTVEVSSRPKTGTRVSLVVPGEIVERQLEEVA